VRGASSNRANSSANLGTLPLSWRSIYNRRKSPGTSRFRRRSSPSPLPAKRRPAVQMPSARSVPVSDLCVFPAASKRKSPANRTLCRARGGRHPASALPRDSHASGDSPQHSHAHHRSTTMTGSSPSSPSAPPPVRLPSPGTTAPGFLRPAECRFCTVAGVDGTSDVRSFEPDCCPPGPSNETRTPARPPGELRGSRSAAANGGQTVPRGRTASRAGHRTKRPNRLTHARRTNRQAPGFRIGVRAGRRAESGSHGRDLSRSRSDQRVCGQEYASARGSGSGRRPERGRTRPVAGGRVESKRRLGGVSATCRKVVGRVGVLSGGAHAQ